MTQMNDILVHDVPINLKDAEEHLIKMALGISKSRTDAANHLGMTRRALRRKFAKYGWPSETVDRMLGTYTALADRPGPAIATDDFEWIPLGTVPYTGAESGPVD